MLQFRNISYCFDLVNIEKQDYLSFASKLYLNLLSLKILMIFMQISTKQKETLGLPWWRSG